MTTDNEQQGTNSNVILARHQLAVALSASPAQEASWQADAAHKPHRWAAAAISLLRRAPVVFLKNPAHK